MEYLFLFLGLPLIALLVDSVWSYKTFPSVALLAFPPTRWSGDSKEQDETRDSDRTANRPSSSTEAIRIVLQSNDERLLRSEGTPVQIVVECLGRQQFAAISDESLSCPAVRPQTISQAEAGNAGIKSAVHSMPASDGLSQEVVSERHATDFVLGHFGPFDGVTVGQSRREAGRLVLSLPYLRPFKTWTFWVGVEPGLQGAEIELRVPKRSPLRRLLLLINRHAFVFEKLSLGISRKRIRVQASVVRIDLKRDWLRASLNVLLPMVVVGAISYGLFFNRELAPAREAFQLLRPGSADPFWVDVDSLWLDLVVLVVGFLCVFAITRDELPPIGDGYSRYQRPHLGQSPRRASRAGRSTGR